MRGHRAPFKLAAVEEGAPAGGHPGYEEQVPHKTRRRFLRRALVTREKNEQRKGQDRGLRVSSQNCPLAQIGQEWRPPTTTTGWS
ncbi:hypothetical protein MRX96_027703 [Rhipicephalus microplus]